MKNYADRIGCYVPRLKTLIAPPTLPPPKIIILLELALTIFDVLEKRLLGLDHRQAAKLFIHE